MLGLINAKIKNYLKKPYERKDFMEKIKSMIS